MALLGKAGKQEKLKKDAALWGGSFHIVVQKNAAPKGGNWQGIGGFLQER